MTDLIEKSLSLNETKTRRVINTSAALHFPGTRGERPENLAKAKQFEAGPFARQHCRSGGLIARRWKPSLCCSHHQLRELHSATDRGGFRRADRRVRTATGPGDTADA